MPFYSLEGGPRRSIFSDVVQAVVFVVFPGAVPAWVLPAHAPGALLAIGGFALDSGVDLLLVALLSAARWLSSWRRSSCSRAASAARPHRSASRSGAASPIGVLQAADPIPASWAIGDSRYALLLGAKLYGLVLCTALFFLPVALPRHRRVAGAASTAA